MFDRQRQQIGIGNLSRAVNPRAIHCAGINDGRVVGPETMRRVVQSTFQPLHDLVHRPRARVCGLRHDADAPVLRDGARRPAMFDIGLQPSKSKIMVRVGLVEERDQDVYIEQPAHQVF